MKTHLFAPLSFVLFAIFLAASHPPAAFGQGEIGYVEDFSLAPDRAEALKLLIPGTRDYYYYTALHLQNQGKFGEVDKILAQWIKRHNSSGRTEEIQNRQALLRYKENAKKSLDYLRHKLGLSFSHQQERLDQKPNLPNALDQNRISRKTLLARAFSRHRGINGLEFSALDWVLRTQVKLDTTRRRHLLQTLKHPDYPGLVDLIAGDLKTKESRGFGSFAIHRALLPGQLDELLEKLPELIRNTNYVNAVISKMLPSEDINWKADREAFGAYLTRVWGFVKNLDPAFNSLKANTLHQLLSWHRANGNYPKDLFMEYVKMPRQLHYVNPDYLKGQTIQVRNHLVDLNRDFQKVNHCPPVRNDEALLRAFFLHFFIKEATFIPYAKYIRDTWLKPIFAEAKIVNGVGDQEKWYAMLSPSAYQALKDRIDIEFAATNPKMFAPGDAVSLDVHVKNVRKLIVKVYEINALNVYLDTNRELSTDLNLDGLVANFEEKHAYEESPLRRVRRTFKIPALAGKRGTWIVELIGNGRSSRAVVRKGRLQFLARTTAAGTGFTVLDQDNKPAKAPAVWMGGRKFTPGKGKEIVVPFSTRPGRVPVVLTDGNLATLAHHQHPGENYRLAAGFHVDREALLGGAKADLAVRARLSLNGVPVPIGLLEDVKLTISSTDLDGISASQVVTAVKLDDKGEFTHALSVPQRLRSLAVQLSGKIRSVSQAKDLPLHAQRGFAVNGIDATAHVDDVHLSKFGSAHVLEVFGRNGEPLAERAVQVHVKHRDFKENVHVPLMTDAEGRVQLGALKDIVWITAAGPSGQTRRWNLLKDRHSLPGNVHGAAGAPVNVAYMGTEEEARREEFALLELRGGTFTSDRFASLRIEDGMVVADGLAAGDYKLVMRPSGREINLRVAKGEAGHGHVLGAHRHLQIVNYQPLQIRSVAKKGENLVIQVDHAHAGWARVHVIANRFYPEFRLYSGLGGVGVPEPFEITRAHVPSLYISGRDIGEEYRYIIERQYAKKFPGNMLTRPGLLLNPWAVRTTETGRQDARAGEKFGRAATGAGGAATAEPGARDGEGGQTAGYADLEFLTDSSICLYNLRPDKNGVITIPLKDIGDRQHVHVLAADPRNSALRHFTLAERGTKFQDLRLRNGIDPAGHFTQAKRISASDAKGKVAITDPRSSRFEVYDTVGKVYTLFRTLNPDPKLAEFQFILDWPKMDDDKKREKYKEFACHELHFFLAHRDPEFFKAVVQPYLRNKMDKTFLDDYLIEADLSRYLKPWFYNRLNMVEKVLLARRIDGEQAATARHVKDRFDLILPDRDRFDHLFRTALVGQALAASGGAAGVLMEGLGFDAEAEEEPADAPTGSVVALPGMSRNSNSAVPAPDVAAPRAVTALTSKKKALASRELRKGAGKGDGRRLKELARKFEADGKDMDAALGDLSGALALRKKQRAFYRKMDKTQEWAENNYYKLRITEQVGALVGVNAFWKDYAAWDGKGEFLSPHMAESTRNFTEMMFALAVLDVPFEAAEHDAKPVEGSLEITLGSPAVVFHREVLPAEAAKGKTPVMVGQNFFRFGDRYTHVDNEQVDKFVTDEFLKGVVYGCQVVVTNPTSSVQKLDLLVQIPRMALPIAKSRTTASFPLRLEPFSTHKMEYHFYFPASSGEKTFPQFPVHVGKDDLAMAWAEPFSFKVVDKLSNIDKASWDYISQFGTEDDVITYLHEHNIDRIKVARIAWRVRDAKFFEKVIPLLQKRHIYDHTLWSYGIHHNKVPQIRQFLLHSDGFLKRCGDWIDCELVTIDPVERRAYEHLEYSPLVNARAHQLGKRRRILNNYFHQQYHRLMKILTYRPVLDDADNMSVAYYLFLQDRVEEGLAHFDKVNARRLPTKLQHDYMSCYAAFYREKPAEAKTIAARYAEFPAERWRGLFAQVVTQADAIRGAAGEAAVHDKDDREQLQDELASTEPSIDLKVENRKVEIAFQNLKQVTVNYYRMDLEFLFSTNPFVGSESKRFGTIRPNKSAKVRLPAGKEKHAFDLPKEFLGDNVLVEVVAAGLRKAQAYYSNDLRVQLVENYGRVEVRDAKSGKPLPRVYVKVYAETPGAAKPKFFKDGYTDLRGKFDYTSLNTGEIDQVSRFSILILSETHGALVREAKPPKR